MRPDHPRSILGPASVAVLVTLCLACGDDDDDARVEAVGAVESEWGFPADEYEKAREAMRAEAVAEGRRIAREEPWFCSDELPEPSAHPVPSWVRIEPGRFVMGRGRSGPDRAHTVTITRPYEMMTTEATIGMWLDLVGPFHGPSVKGCCREDCPLTGAAFWEMLAFANALSRREGLPECYDLDGCPEPTAEYQRRAPCDLEGMDAGLECEGYRLPTDAEWEYAARAGTRGRFWCGNDSSCLRGREWVALPHSAGEHPRPVAVGEANPWGLYDLAGNVREIVWDRYEPLARRPVVDPVGPDQADDGNRIHRGLAWDSSISSERSIAERHDKWVSWWNGFRLVRTLGAEPSRP